MHLFAEEKKYETKVVQAPLAVAFIEWIQVKINNEFQIFTYFWQSQIKSWNLHFTEQLCRIRMFGKTCKQIGLISFG